MRRRIRAKGQVKRFGCRAQIVQNATGLDPRNAFLGVELENAVEIFGEVDDNRSIAALAGKTCSRTSIGERGTELSAHRDNLLYLLDRAWKDDADRHLTIIRSVGRIERSRLSVESNLARNDPFQLTVER